MSAHLAELNTWCASLYGAWDVKHQGHISSHIPVPLDAVGDILPQQVLHYAFEHARWAQNEARLLPGEFSAVAMASYAAERYLGSVLNGGHMQYLDRDKWNPIVTRFCAAGLRAMECSAFAEIHARVDAFVQADLPRAARLAAIYSGEPDESDEIDDPYPDDVRPFDKAIFALSLDDQLARHASWLRASGELLPVADVEGARAEIVAKNTLFDLRERRSTRDLAPTKDQVLTAERVAMRFKKKGFPDLGRAQWLSETSLDELIFASDPIRIVSWSFSEVSLKEQFTQRLKAPSFNIAFVPSYKGAPPQATLLGETPGVLATLDIEAREFDLCSLRR